MYIISASLATGDVIVVRKVGSLRDLLRIVA